MSEKVGKADTCVFFYSQDAAISDPVKNERDMAVYKNKYIIPGFKDLDTVPLILQIRTGINISSMSIDEIANEIYRLIKIKYDLSYEESIKKKQEYNKEKGNENKIEIEMET